MLNKLGKLLKRKLDSYVFGIYLKSLKRFGLNIVYNKKLAGNTSPDLFNVLYISESPEYARQMGWYSDSHLADAEVSFRHISLTDSKFHINPKGIYSLVDRFASKSWAEPLDKTRKQVMVPLSNKAFLPGHKIRHQIFEKYRGDPFFSFVGGGAGKNVSDLGKSYREYLYIVVIENIKTEQYTSEKIFDAIYYRSLPIYYGATKELSVLGFDTDGILQFSDIESFSEVMEEVMADPEGLYNSKFDSIEHNFQILKELRKNLMEMFLITSITPIYIRGKNQWKTSKEDWERFFN